MFKRILLALTFVTALCVTSLATPDTAEAWRYWGRGPYAGSYYGYYGAPRYRSWGYGVPYRSYRRYYAPRYYADPYYADPYYGGYYSGYYVRPRYYAYPDYYYAGPRGRVAFSVGF